MIHEIRRSHVLHNSSLGVISFIYVRDWWNQNRYNFYPRWKFEISLVFEIICQAKLYECSCLRTQLETWAFVAYPWICLISWDHDKELIVSVNFTIDYEIILNHWKVQTSNILLSNLYLSNKTAQYDFSWVWWMFFFSKANTEKDDPILWIVMKKLYLRCTWMIWRMQFS